MSLTLNFAVLKISFFNYSSFKLSDPSVLKYLEISFFFLFFLNSQSSAMNSRKKNFFSPPFLLFLTYFIDIFSNIRMDVQEFRQRGKEMIDYICEYLEKLPTRRVTPSIEPGYLRPLLSPEAPKEPESWEDIMKDVESKIMPGIIIYPSSKDFNFLKFTLTRSINFMLLQASLTGNIPGFTLTFPAEILSRVFWVTCFLPESGASGFLG